MLNSWARSNWFNFTAIRWSRKFRKYNNMLVPMQIEQVSSTEPCPTHTVHDFFSEILLSTAHKAKGLEFPIVILADDFLPRSNETPLDELSVESKAKTAKEILFTFLPIQLSSVTKKEENKSLGIFVFIFIFSKWQLPVISHHYPFVFNIYLNRSKLSKIFILLSIDFFLLIIANKISDLSGWFRCLDAHELMFSKL